MRAYVVLAGAALSLVGMGLDLAVGQAVAPDQKNAKSEKNETPAPKAADTKSGVAKDVASPQEKPQEKEGKNAPPAAKDEAKQVKPEKQPAEGSQQKAAAVPEKYAADEKAIREVHAALIKAYSSDDAKSVGSHFVSGAEYINAHGSIFQGRQEIEESLAESMADHPGCKLESEIDGLRFVSPTVALVDALVTITHAEEEQAEPTTCHSSIVFLKTNDQWQIASVRDQHAAPFPRHEDRLAQLDFLIGEWVDEHDQSVLSFSCRLDENDKFLLRDFTLKLSGQDVLTGTQRIGWDPLSGKLRTWIFDSEGGFAEGVWQRSEDGWEVKTAGVTSDGEIATGTSIYKIVNDHTMTWQAVGHEIGGVHVPDSPVFTLTHQAPRPSADEPTPAVGQTK